MGVAPSSESNEKDAYQDAYIKIDNVFISDCPLYDANDGSFKKLSCFFLTPPMAPSQCPILLPPPPRPSEIVRSDWLKSNFVVFFKMAEHVPVSRKTRFQIDICLYIALLNA